MFHVKHKSLPVSRETAAQLETYASLLLKWNPVINLISKKDEVVLWERHIADSLQLIPHLPHGLTTAIDLGSGGGLPGLVLAIASGVHFDLIESDQRKATFLREAARATGAHVTIHAKRIDVVNLPPAKLITARALAPLPILIALAEPYLSKDGTLLAPKGASVEAELTAAAEQWHMRVQRFPSVTDPTATILQITEVHRVGQSS